MDLKKPGILPSGVRKKRGTGVGTQWEESGVLATELLMSLRPLLKRAEEELQAQNRRDESCVKRATEAHASQ